MNSELRLFWGIDYYGFIGEVLGEIRLDDPQKRILDIATGTGFIPRYFRERRNADNSITGLDITFEMLLNGKKSLSKNGSIKGIDLVCASAHDMPFKQASFDVAICCLATHHMSVGKLLSQIQYGLRPGGKVFIGDVGGSARWKIGFIRNVIKIFAFFYFLFAENFSRAKAESGAVANVMTSEEWYNRIIANNFENIKIREIQSSRFWTPNPIIIEATKLSTENE